jgi:hypothetical protein
MKAIFIISSLKLRLIIATADGENKVFKNLGWHHSGSRGCD